MLRCEVVTRGNTSTSFGPIDVSHRGSIEAVGLSRRRSIATVLRPTPSGAREGTGPFDRVEGLRRIH